MKQAIKNNLRIIYYQVSFLLLFSLMLMSFSVAAASDDPGAERLGNVSSISDGFTQKESLLRLVGTTPFYPVDFTHNSRYDDCILLHGIDVSKYQKEIDWKKVKNAGVDFAFVRVGYRGYGAGGNFGFDEYYDANMQGAISQGIPVGIYFFSQAITEQEAIDEANYILDRIGSYNVTLPLVMDFEYASANGKQTGRLYDAGLSKQKATNICLAFCKTIEAAGYTPMVYANYNMLTTGLYPEQISNRYPIWLANYTNKTSYTGDYSFWQYTSKGTVDGISGAVDCNFWYKTTPEAVANLSAKDTTASTLSLSWKETTGAMGYQVYRSETPTGGFQKIASLPGISSTTFEDDELSAASTYYYKVRAYLKYNQKNYFGKFSSVLPVHTLPDTPDNLSVIPGNKQNATLSWQKDSSADGYRIYSYDSETGKKRKIKTIYGASNTSYTLNNLPEKPLLYQAASFYRSQSGTLFSLLSEPIEAAPKPAVITDLSAIGKTSSKIRLSFTPIAYADGYQIYAYNEAEGKYTKLRTVKAEELENDGTVLITNLDSMQKYSFKIRAYRKLNKKNCFGNFSSVLSVKTK